MLTDRDYILHYRTCIEKKFQLGDDNGKLRQRELEYIANLVEEKSKVKLSISTLKRLWRGEVVQLPHPSTLDALVSVLDFRDWQDFKKQSVGALSSINATHVSETATHKNRRRVPIVVLLFVGSLILAGSFFVLQGFMKKRVTITKPVVFTADKTVTSGVPNTVMFNYDLSGVTADSFFIQQSWNPRDKTEIDPAKSYYSSIYYTPGFHFARIMANDSILKFQSVHIKTDGWLPMIKRSLSDKVPIYLNPSNIVSEGKLQLTQKALSSANIDVSKDFFLRYYNIRDFDGITSDNFDLETRLKCDRLLKAGGPRSVACPLMEIMLITEENVFFIPLTTKGCVSELDLLIGETYKSGKDNDLSAFGVDVFDWQTLRLKVENKNATIYLNNTAIHSLKFNDDFGNLKGIIYTFTGIGSVDFLHVRDVNGELVYGDEFEPVLD